MQQPRRSFPVPSKRLTNTGLYCLLMVALGAIAFSPLFGWASLIFLTIFCGHLHRRVRWILGCGIVFCGALSYASRETSGLANDDFYFTYYPNFLVIQEFGLFEFIRRLHENYSLAIGISIVELGLYVWFYAVGLVFGKISIALLIFLTTAAIAFLYWMWLEFYLIPEIPERRRAVVMALCLTLFSYGLCSQLSRQMFSIPFILAALWEKRLLRAVLWLIMGALFHLSAFPIAFFGWSVRRWPRLCLGALAGMLFVLFVWPSMLPSIGAFIAFDKFAYYSSGVSSELAGFDLKYLLVGLSPAVLGCFALANRRLMLGNLMIASALVYLLLLPMPLASFRTTLFVSTALLGPALVCGVINRVGASLFALFCVCVALAMLSRRAQLNEAGVGMPLWQKFSRADVVPFYYAAEIRK